MGLITVTTDYDKAFRIMRQYRDAGLNAYIEHAWLKEDGEVKGAYAVGADIVTAEDWEKAASVETTV